MITNVAWTTAI